MLAAFAQYSDIGWASIERAIYCNTKFCNVPGIIRSTSSFRRAYSPDDVDWFNLELLIASRGVSKARFKALPILCVPIDPAELILGALNNLLTMSTRSSEDTRSITDLSKRRRLIRRRSAGFKRVEERDRLIAQFEFIRVLTSSTSIGRLDKEAKIAECDPFIHEFSLIRAPPMADDFP